MRPVFFMHIPKTGGTSIHHALAETYGPCLFYPPLASAEQADKLGKNLASFENRIANAETVQRDQLLRILRSQPFIGGHTDSALLQFLRTDRFVFTCFRDPVDRLVSYYFHAVHPEKPGHRRRYGRETAGMDFFEFLAFKPLREKMDNQLTRFLSAARSKNRVDESDLKKALGTLERLDHVCFQDRLSGDLHDIAELLGIERIETPTLKMGQSRQSMDLSIPGPDDPRIRSFVQFDYLLYEAARAR